MDVSSYFEGRGQRDVGRDYWRRREWGGAFRLSCVVSWARRKKGRYWRNSD